MRREDTERLAIATMVAALLAKDYRPESALHEAEKVWSEISQSTSYGSANEEDSRADYVRLLSNHYSVGLARGMTPDAAIAFARDATSVLLREIDPAYVE